MNDEEIEDLISELRALLDENGFSWAREQAEAAMDTGWPRRRVAVAWLEVTENVTVVLAHAELDMLLAFDVEDILFQPDDYAVPDGDIFDPDARREASGEIDAPIGSRRRGALLELADRRDTFQLLRERLNGSD